MSDGGGSQVLERAVGWGVKGSQEVQPHSEGPANGPSRVNWSGFTLERAPRLL